MVRLRVKTKRTTARRGVTAIASQSKTRSSPVRAYLTSRKLGGGMQLILMWRCLARCPLIVRGRDESRFYGASGGRPALGFGGIPSAILLAACLEGRDVWPLTRSAALALPSG